MYRKPQLWSFRFFTQNQNLMSQRDESLATTVQKFQASWYFLILCAEDLAMAFELSSIMLLSANASSLAAHQSHRAGVIRLCLLLACSSEFLVDIAASQRGPATAHPSFVPALPHTSSPAISIHLRAARKECNESMPSAVLASHSSESARTRKAKGYRQSKLQGELILPSMR